jgi:IS5 family transposase
VKLAYTDRTAEARSYQHSIGVWLRRRSDDAKAEVPAITGRLADLAEAAVADATRTLYYKARRRKVPRLLDELAVLIDRTVQVIAQARTRVNGGQPHGATRLVSLHEPDARPIRKGRLGRPVEFGYKAQAVDTAEGIIIDHSVHIGNPSDTDLIRPAFERITTRIGPPATVTADRGYWDSTVEADLAALGVTTVLIPRPEKASQARAAIEHADTFIEIVKWRTGSEGRISHLKRDWAWRRASPRSVEASPMRNGDARDTTKIRS